MPELPEVETVRRALAAALDGRRLTGFRAGVATLRGPVPLAALRRALVGRAVRAVRRRAKYLIVETDGARAMSLHLGMTGSLSVVPADAPVGKHEHLRVALDDGREVRFNDPRRFGSVAVHALRAPGADPDFLAACGPEPLERTFSGASLFASTRGRRGPIKAFLLDQRRVAGVGNIYASEALHRAGLHPGRPAASLVRAEADRLARAVKAVLRAAIRAGGTTISDHRQLSGEEGRFQRALAVYGRAGQPCPACRTPVALLRQSGRSTFFCPRCQPE